jgi:hypothetical protein
VYTCYTITCIKQVVNGGKNMKIIENGKLFPEHLRHPISAYYIQRNPDALGIFDIILRMFGFSI